MNDEDVNVRFLSCGRVVANSLITENNEKSRSNIQTSKAIFDSRQSATPRLRLIPKGITNVT